ncbi:MAG: carboxypeptidase-like regulatory domain-containing protein [Terracidiphilus sp.]
MLTVSWKQVLRSGSFSYLVAIISILLGFSNPITAQEVPAPEPQTASISGTATDADLAVVPGVQVTLNGPGANLPRSVVADENGAFSFTGLQPGGPFYVTIQGDGLVPWTSPTLTLAPGQVLFLSGVQVRFSGAATSVTVFGSPDQIAAQQVSVEEKQRVLGIVPNFYVVYDQNAVPLTTKLKYHLAFRAATDPVVFLGSALVAGMDQAGDTPDYEQGAKGYGQRLGANYATGFADVMIGGAVLPSLLHQDPRYFYQGTGTTRSRLFHALSSPFICKGDNGRLQPNFSSVGGDLAAGGIAQLYYPESNRGAALVFQSTLITAAGRMANGVIQEFVLRKLTPSARQ